MNYISSSISRDYRRRTHRDRDGAGRWEREPSRDRWYRDRHREYREDYWSDSGNHYDRGSSRGDYEEMGGVRGSRQRVEREKKRAENFFQEARRRKHEADNIGVSLAGKGSSELHAIFCVFPQMVIGLLNAEQSNYRKLAS